MHRSLAGLVMAVAGGALALAVAAPAYAQPRTIPINDGQPPTRAVEIQRQICEGPFRDLPANVDGWHFLLPDSAGSQLESLRLIFDPGYRRKIVSIDSRSSNRPDTGRGWSGYLSDAGDGFKNAYVVTEAGWTLRAGSAVVEGAAAKGSFMLHHTCPGAPTAAGPGY
jgi:hypothetical protein